MANGSNPDTDTGFAADAESFAAGPDTERETVTSDDTDPRTAATDRERDTTRDGAGFNMGSRDRQISAGSGTGERGSVTERGSSTGTESVGGDASETSGAFESGPSTGMDGEITQRSVSDPLSPAQRRAGTKRERGGRYRDTTYNRVARGTHGQFERQSQQRQQQSRGGNNGGGGFAMVSPGLNRLGKLPGQAADAVTGAGETAADVGSDVVTGIQDTRGSRRKERQFWDSVFGPVDDTAQQGYENAVEGISNLVNLPGEEPGPEREEKVLDTVIGEERRDTAREGQQEFREGVFETYGRAKRRRNRVTDDVTVYDAPVFSVPNPMDAGPSYIPLAPSPYGIGPLATTSASGTGGASAGSTGATGASATGTGAGTATAEGAVSAELAKVAGLSGFDGLFQQREVTPTDTEEVEPSNRFNEPEVPVDEETTVRDSEIPVDEDTTGRPPELPVPEDYSVGNEVTPDEIGIRVSPVVIPGTTIPTELPDPEQPGPSIPTELPDPEQPGPSTKKRNRRDDLFTPERGFYTGESAVVGRETPESEELQEEAQQIETLQRPDVFVGETTLADMGPRLSPRITPGVLTDPRTDETQDQRQPQDERQDQRIGEDVVDVFDVGGTTVETNTQTTTTQQQVTETPTETPTGTPTLNPPEYPNPPEYGDPTEQRYPYPTETGTPPPTRLRRPRFPELESGDDDEEDTPLLGFGVAPILTDFVDPVTGDVLETETED